MAQYSDSINFNKGELDVNVIRTNSNFTTYIITLNEIRTLRDEGEFNDSIVLYTFENFGFDYNNQNVPVNFLKSNLEYELVINNNITGNSVSSTTEILNSFNFSPQISTNSLSFYLPGVGYNRRTFKWNDPVNAEVFQFNLILHYKENGIVKELSWNQTELGRNIELVSLSGEDFFSNLSNNLSEINGIREFINIDIVMTLSTSELKTYIAVNEPMSGFVQQRPMFTNINNGIGLFSSRYTKVYPNLYLSSDSKDYIINELDLNFQ